MALKRGAHIFTLYNLLGITKNNDYYNIIILEADEISSCLVN